MEAATAFTHAQWEEFSLGTEKREPPSLYGHFIFWEAHRGVSPEPWWPMPCAAPSRWTEGWSPCVVYRSARLPSPPPWSTVSTAVGLFGTKSGGTFSTDAQKHMPCWLFWTAFCKNKVYLSPSRRLVQTKLTFHVVPWGTTMGQPGCGSVSLQGSLLWFFLLLQVTFRPAFCPFDGSDKCKSS